MIHGDIKPPNVLVFTDAAGKSRVKMTDFGYSTLATGEAGTICLPKARPWNSPEHHFGGFTPTEAKKSDIYTFGLLCLWVIFPNCLLNIPSCNTECGTESGSFDTPTGPRTLLERLKDDDQVESIAVRHVQSAPYLRAKLKICLKEFFRLTVTHNPAKRTSDLGKLVGLLSYSQ